MAAETIWLTEGEVTRLLPLADALPALERAVVAEGEGKAHNVPKALGRWAPGTAMHCLGAMWPEAGFVGWKTWAVTGKGGFVTYELFDAATGALRAVIEAAAMGQLRTSSMTGLGTKWLAPAGADTLALIGVGRQALAQVAAIHAVRPLRAVSVYSRDPAKRAAFAEEIGESLAIDARPAERMEEAIAAAAITTLVTRAEEPFLTAAMLPSGAHLNAVGAILPTHAEFAQDVFDRVGLIGVDSIADVRRNSREFRERFGDGEWPAVRSLGSIAAAGAPRPADVDISLFKSMGMGLSDLAMAIEVYGRATAQGVGTRIATGEPSRIRWS